MEILRTIAVMIISGIWFVWPYAWLGVFFIRGYIRIRYPGGQKGVNPLDKEATDNVRRSGWTWIIISLVAILLWLALPLVIY